MENYMARLNEYAQKKRLVLRFEDVACDGPDHIKTFTIRVVLNGEAYPEGVGKNKKQARQKAAENALRALKELPNSETSTTSSEETEESSMSMDAERVESDKSASIKELKNIQTLSRFKKEFEVIECLGHGAFGRVYKVEHKELRKPYAVKIVLHERDSLREVDVLSDLLHKNIIRYYSFWEQDYDEGNEYMTDSSSASFSSSSLSTGSSTPCFLYIQMELCDSKTLTTWIKDKNSESPNIYIRRRDGLDIALQITSGVEYIHDKGCIHRDLKPDNILFGLDGAVKIGDFGLVTRDTDDGNRTADVGTPSYMAPEQKKKNYDRKVDIFSMGLIFLELWWKISSDHERANIFRDAKRQKLPNKFPLDYFKENQLILSMLGERPTGRPEASEVKKKLQSLEGGRRGAQVQSQSV